jgi:DNA-binding NtrC family response regulator
LARRFSSGRAPTLLIIDSDPALTDTLARELGQEGIHVFWTSAAEVALRLSHEHYFDLVVIDTTLPDDARALADTILRHGHRAIIVSGVAGSFPPPDGRWGQGVSGLVLRPLTCERLLRLISELILDVDNFYRELDVLRQ